MSLCFSEVSNASVLLTGCGISATKFNFLTWEEEMSLIWPLLARWSHLSPFLVPYFTLQSHLGVCCFPDTSWRASLYASAHTVLSTPVPILLISLRSTYPLRIYSALMSSINSPFHPRPHQVWERAPGLGTRSSRTWITGQVVRAEIQVWEIR